MVYDGDGQKLA